MDKLDVTIFTTKERKLSGEIERKDSELKFTNIKDETIYIDARGVERPDGLLIGVTLKIGDIKFAIENDSQIVVHKESGAVLVSKPSTLLIGSISDYDQFFQVLSLTPQVSISVEKLPEHTEWVERMGVFGKEKYALYITPVRVEFKVNEHYKVTVNGRITRV